jgi:hypothetical protein
MVAEPVVYKMRQVAALNGVERLRSEDVIETSLCGAMLGCMEPAVGFHLIAVQGTEDIGHVKGSEP